MSDDVEIYSTATSAMAASGDNWLQEYDNCERCYREILGKINKRDGQPRSTQVYAQLSTSARLQIKKFSDDLITLRQNLIRASSSSLLTHRELERRQMMLDNLEKKQIQVQQSFNRQNSTLANDRSELLNQDFAHPSTTTWPREEGDDTKYLSIDEIRNKQQNAIADQDRGLEVLSQAISRQKHVGLAIADELDVQTDLVEDITEHADRTRERLIKETNHVQIVDRKSGACGFWIVIILMLIAIVIVSTVPAP